MNRERLRKGDIVELDKARLKDYLDKGTYYEPINMNRQFHACSDVPKYKVEDFLEYSKSNPCLILSVESCGCCFIHNLNIHLPRKILRRKK